MKLSEITITPILDTLRMEDISDDIYFSERYSNYISNSRLKLIDPDEGGCPQDFFETKPIQRSDSLRFGSAVHTLTLQPEEFVLIDKVDAPTAKAHYMAEYLFDVMKKKGTKNPTDEEIIEASDVIDYYKGKMNSKKISDLRSKCNQYWIQRFLFEHDYKGTQTPIYLDVKSREKLQACLASLEKDKAIQKLLKPEGLLQDPITGNEKAILLDVKVEAPEHQPFVLRLKSKLDNYSIDLDTNTITVNDLKTTGRLVTEFNDAIIKYHYQRELAMYSWLLTMCAKKFYNVEQPIIKGNFLVVETIPNYYTKVVPMTKKLYSDGFKEFSKLLKLVAYYVMHGYEEFGIKL